MYREKESRSSKIINFILALIAIFIIIFIITWIVYKSNNKNITKQFKTNLITMQEAAKSYFATSLPEDIGDSKSITLDEMYDLEIIDEINYGTVSCDEDLSYITITKTNLDTYNVKSNLVCGNKNDSIQEKVDTTTIINNIDNETIIDENTTIINETITEDNNDTIIIEENDTIDDNSTIDYDNVTSTDGKTIDYCKVHNCTSYIIPSNCETDYEFQFAKTTTSCNDGYILSNGICVRTINEVSDPVTQSTETDAIVNDGTSYKVYIDPIVNPGTSTTTCPDGYNLENGACYKYIEKTTANSCPEGYTLENNMCYKYTDVTTTATCPTGYEAKDGKCYAYTTVNVDVTCPTGYELKNGACYKYTDTIGETTCPNGYTLNNGMCYKYAESISNSYCPSGYTEKDGSCYKYTDIKETSYCPLGYTSGSDGKCYDYVSPNKNGSTTYSCPSGYSKSGSGSSTKCTKTIDANKSYSSWGNPVKTYTTTTKESTYTKDLEKKVLLGTKSAAGKTIYSYAIYKRTVSYSCSQGTKDGSKCIITTSPTTNTSYTYSCPNGYASSGSGSSMKCFKTTTKTTSTYCPLGYSKSGNTCYIKTSKTTTTTCPSGYTKSGNTCYIKASATSNSYCPSGYTKSGNICYIKTDSTVNKSCDNGYTLNNNVCYKTQSMNINTICPSGYTKSGNVCYTTTSITTTNGCPTGYTLNGNICFKKENANTNTTEATYTCPSGYTKEGNGSSIKCYQNYRTEDTYYCRNANEQLVGNKCISSYTRCPDGFVNNNGVCLKTTNDYQDPIRTVEYTYSASEYLEGYYRTGRATFVTTCTPAYK